MRIYPAIDILDGKAVRLYGGDYGKVTVYGEPLDFARRFIADGASVLHVVDLNAAKSQGDNLSIIQKIAALDVEVQTGGGVRTYSDFVKRLDSGAKYIVLGTVCVKDRAQALRIISDFPQNAVLGVDCLNNKIAVSGWTEDSEIDVADFVADYAKAGAKIAVVTDISKDGKLVGVNTQLCKRVSDFGLQVIASGGVSNLSDIIELSRNNIFGAIAGKSLYENIFTVKQALQAAKGV